MIGDVRRPTAPAAPLGLTRQRSSPCTPAFAARAAPPARPLLVPAPLGLRPARRRGRLGGAGSWQEAEAGLWGLGPKEPWRGGRLAGSGGRLVEPLVGAGAGGAMEGRAAGGWQCMRFGDGVRLRGMRGVMVCRDLSPPLDALRKFFKKEFFSYLKY